MRFQRTFWRDKISVVNPSLPKRHAHFTAPYGVTFVPELPKTAAGEEPEVRSAESEAAIVRQ